MSGMHTQEGGGGIAGEVGPDSLLNRAKVWAIAGLMLRQRVEPRIRVL